MPELRVDPITARRVFVAEERAGRPFDYAPALAAVGPTEAGQCPFCAGHEALTPNASATVFDAEGRWQIRVVPNKYPAVTLAPGTPAGSAVAFGAHEVIIEAPQHVLALTECPASHLSVVLQVYQDRLRHWAVDGRIRHVLIFKNSGYAAGASLEHVHSQLIALPLAPPAVQLELDAATRHFVAAGRCVFCDLIRSELADGRRVVLRERGFIAFTAVAGRQPYETWILPEAHAAHFSAMDESATDALASVLRRVLRCLQAAAAGAAYNLILHTADFGDAHEPSFHWHWELVPRITQLAGLELGGAAFINPVAPERAAQRLRDAV
jgi:UDPglucose--hexose-1-phosphate uridylyltransferase